MSDSRTGRRVGALAFLIGAAACAETPLTYVDWYRSAATAYEAEDFAEFRSAVRGALTLRPDYPPMLYNLAAAEARMDNPGGALAVLERLARMGLAYDPREDPDFATLADTPAFAGVASHLARNGEAQG
ncbi:MAG: hypothetical protein KJN93_05470, partial [Alphaproteobacteria bacterium]|nr:hypothetical protein [Alphaproteobacteria bacterium]